jgi:hypothetical protein
MSFDMEFRVNIESFYRFEVLKLPEYVIKSGLEHCNYHYSY